MPMMMARPCQFLRFLRPRARGTQKPMASGSMPPVELLTAGSPMGMLGSRQVVTMMAMSPGGCVFANMTKSTNSTNLEKTQVVCNVETNQVCSFALRCLMVGDCQSAISSTYGISNFSSLPQPQPQPQPTGEIGTNESAGVGSESHPFFFGEIGKDLGFIVALVGGCFVALCACAYWFNCGTESQAKHMSSERTLSIPWTASLPLNGLAKVVQHTEGSGAASANRWRCCS